MSVEMYQTMTAEVIIFLLYLINKHQNNILENRQSIHRQIFIHK
jgi:hypothetical protein